MRYRRWAWVGLAVLVCCAGCSKKSLAPVSGTVAIDNKPLERGKVTFHPVNTGQVGYGTVRPDGRYTAETSAEPGLAPGEYRVTVVATGEPPKAASRPGPGAAEQPPPLLTPAKYARPDTSNLHYTVPPSGGTFDILLKSK